MSYQSFLRQIQKSYRLSLHQRNDGWYNWGYLMNITDDKVSSTSTLQLVLWHIFPVGGTINLSLPMVAVKSKIYFLPVSKDRITWHLSRNKKLKWVPNSLMQQRDGTPLLSATSLQYISVDSDISSTVALLPCLFTHVLQHISGRAHV